MSDELKDTIGLTELARMLDTSTRTIERRLRAGGAGLPPDLRSTTNRHKWSRAAVQAWQRREDQEAARRPRGLRRAS